MRRMHLTGTRTDQGSLLGERANRMATIIIQGWARATGSVDGVVGGYIFSFVSPTSVLQLSLCSLLFDLLFLLLGGVSVW
jgi:hypothetical protein